eukprot:2240683-Pleurochrysis_carterae.AAC.1
MPPAADHAAASKSSDFVPLAAKAGATIVPVAAIGAEEGFNMLLDADEMLELPYFGERLRESAKSTPVGRPGAKTAHAHVHARACPCIRTLALALALTRARTHVFEAGLTGCAACLRALHSREKAMPTRVGQHALPCGHGETSHVRA